MVGPLDILNIDIIIPQEQDYVYKILRKVLTLIKTFLRDMVVRYSKNDIISALNEWALGVFR